MIARAGLRPLFYLIYLGGSWGLYFSLLKIAVLSGISYTGIIALTTGGVCIGMIAIALLRRRPPGFEARHHRYYAIAALTGYLLPILAEVLVIGHMPAGMLTLIVSVAPIATLAIAAGMKTDRVDAARIAGMLIGSVAIFAILLPDAHLSAGIDWRWLMLAAIVPLAYALYHNYIALAWPEGSDSFQLACGESVYAVLLLLPLTLLTWDWQDLQAWNDGHSAILVMALIALVDVYIYFELIRIKGPIYCSHANYFMVVSGVLWGILLFGERHGPLLWVSAALLLVSLYLVGYRKPTTA
jgi:drug/metabolite transporter (DMT)-like permease